MQGEVVKAAQPLAERFIYDARIERAETKPDVRQRPEQLLEQVWGFDFFGDSRTVDVHVKRIREKLGDSHPWQLKTVWGVGYKFEKQ